MNEKSRRIPLTSALVGAIIFVVYCLFAFLVFDIKEPLVFWMSFGFMCAAFAAQMLAPSLIARKASAETIFFGIPVVYLGVFYFFAELFASLVFMTFQSVSWKAALLVQVSLLAIFVIAAIVAVQTQVSVQELSEDRRNEAVAFKSQFVDVQTLVDQCARTSNDNVLKRQLEHLSETIRYSDPFGKDEPVIREVEMRIAQKTTDLQASCGSDDTAAAAGVIAELEDLYMERRRKLMLVK